MKLLIVALVAITLCGCRGAEWSGIKLSEAEVFAQYGDVINRMSDMVSNGFSNRNQRLASERQLIETPRPQGIIEASYMLPSGGWQGIWSESIKQKLVYGQNWGTDLKISPVRLWHGDSRDGPYIDALRIQRSVMVDGVEWVVELIIETGEADSP